MASAKHVVKDTNTGKDFVIEDKETIDFLEGRITLDQMTHFPIVFDWKYPYNTLRENDCGVINAEDTLNVLSRLLVSHSVDMQKIQRAGDGIFRFGRKYLEMNPVVIKGRILEWLNNMDRSGKHGEYYARLANGGAGEKTIAEIEIELSRAENEIVDGLYGK